MKTLVRQKFVLSDPRGRVPPRAAMTFMEERRLRRPRRRGSPCILRPGTRIVQPGPLFSGKARDCINRMIINVDGESVKPSGSVVVRIRMNDALFSPCRLLGILLGTNQTMLSILIFIYMYIYIHYMYIYIISPRCNKSCEIATCGSISS